MAVRTALFKTRRQASMWRFHTMPRFAPARAHCTFLKWLPKLKHNARENRLRFLCTTRIYIVKYSPNSFSYRGSGGLDNTGLGLLAGKLRKIASHFYAQARYFVHVTFATLRRNRSLVPLLQKNNVVGAHFPSKTGLAHQLSPESWGMPSGSLLKAS